jgi:hypothetical protein
MESLRQSQIHTESETEPKIKSSVLENGNGHIGENSENFVLEERQQKKQEDLDYLTNLLKELNPESTNVASRDQIQYTDTYIAEIKKKLSDCILKYQHTGNEDIKNLIKEVRKKLDSIEQVNYLTNLLRELNPESTDDESGDQIQYTDAYIAEIKKKLSDFILRYPTEDQIKNLINKVREKLYSIEQAKAKAKAKAKALDYLTNLLRELNPESTDAYIAEIKKKLSDYILKYQHNKGNRDIEILIKEVREKLYSIEQAKAKALDYLTNLLRDLNSEITDGESGDQTQYTYEYISKIKKKLSDLELGYPTEDKIKNLINKVRDKLYSIEQAKAKAKALDYLNNLLRDLNSEITDGESGDQTQYTYEYISKIKKKLSDLVLRYKHTSNENEDIKNLINKVRDKLVKNLFISIQSKLQEYGYNSTEERDFPLIISRINEDIKNLKGLVFGRIFNRKKIKSLDNLLYSLTDSESGMIYQYYKLKNNNFTNK